MDADLKQYLDAKFTDVNAKLADINAKFADIDKRFAEIDKRFADVDKRFAEIDKRFAKIDKRFDDIDKRFDEEREALREVETKLLTAFHAWAQTYEVRARGVGAMVTTLDERLGMIEERVSKLERREYPGRA